MSPDATTQHLTEVIAARWYAMENFGRDIRHAEPGDVRCLLADAAVLAEAVARAGYERTAS